jgi:rubrerythrin
MELHITEVESLEPRTLEYVTRYICKNCDAVWAGSKPRFCPECGYQIKKIRRVHLNENDT